MRLLLDTQVFIWLLRGDSRVGPHSAALVRDPLNQVMLSAASIWEAVIKHALGKLTFPDPPANYLPRKRDELQVSSLPIVEADFVHLAGLPPHHRDPFDRLMIAQALHHGLTI